MRASLLRAGADKVAVNRAAFDDPSILTGLAEEFGSQAVVCAIDAKAGEVVTHAGRNPARPRRGRLGGGGRRARGRRAARDVDRRRRHPRRLRPPTHRRVRGGGRGAGDRLRRRRRGVAPRRAFEVGAEAAIVASIVHERPERLPELKAELREAGWNVRM